MNPMIVRSRVDADGVLRVAVPIGSAEADWVKCKSRLNRCRLTTESTQNIWLGSKSQPGNGKVILRVYRKANSKSGISSNVLAGFQRMDRAVSGEKC